MNRWNEAHKIDMKWVNVSVLLSVGGALGLFVLGVVDMEISPSLGVEGSSALIGVLIPLVVISYGGGLGLGLIGAILMSLWLVDHTLNHHSGPWLFLESWEWLLTVGLVVAIAIFIGYTKDKNNALVAQLESTQNSLAKTLTQLSSFNTLLQELLRESQAYYQSLADILPQSLYRVDRQGKITFANQSFLKIVGLSWQEVIDKTLADIYPQELATENAREDQWVLATGQIVDRVEERRLENSDRYQYFHVIKTPIQSGNGEVIGTQTILLDITERQTMLEALQQSQNRYQLATNAGQVGVWQWDLQHNLFYLDPSLQHLLGQDLAEGKESLFKDWKKLIYSEDRSSIFKLIRQAIAGEVDRYEMTQRLVDKEGKIHWFLLRGTVQRNAQGEAICLMGTGTDITNLKETEAALIKAEAKYHSIFENAIEGIFQSTLDGKFINVNPAFARILGDGSPPDLLQRVKNIKEQVYVNAEDRDRLITLLNQEEKVIGFESQVYRSDGSTIWISENVHCVRNDQGDILYFEGTIENITERKQAQEILEYHAFHDPLTGLLNRAALTERIAIALTTVRQHTNQFFGLLLINLNRFKTINDSLGHFVGDQLLISVARRLESYIANEGVVARLNGDHFAILMPEIASYEEVLDLADSLEEALANEPFWVQGHEVFISATIGIVLSHHISTGLVYEDPESLLRDADTAIYHAKRQGRNHHQLFDSTMRPVDECQFQLEMDLRRAIERQEFCLYYQPIICFKTGKIAGFESLIRWKNQENKLISPGKFIPIAEITGLIIPIGEWVIYEACRQLKFWQTNGLLRDPLSVNVNVSGRQFSQAGLVTIIEESLKTNQLNPEYLRVEITEGLMMENMESVVDQLRQLQDLGVRLCIDDFGTGHSSLSRLQLFPIDTLKIDQSFIPLHSELEKDWELVKSIINLGHSLSMRVVAEGVETSVQQKKLQELGCDYGQGYLFARPLEKEAVIELLHRNPIW